MHVCAAAASPRQLAYVCVRVRVDQLAAFRLCTPSHTAFKNRNGAAPGTEHTGEESGILDASRLTAPFFYQKMSKILWINGSMLRKWKLSPVTNFPNIIVNNYLQIFFSVYNLNKPTKKVYEVS